MPEVDAASEILPPGTMPEVNAVPEILPPALMAAVAEQLLVQSQAMTSMLTTATAVLAEYQVTLAAANAREAEWQANRAAWVGPGKKTRKSTTKARKTTAKRATGRAAA